jgi:malonyl CoA-acyl carrier protein transacylase
MAAVFAGEARVRAALDGYAHLDVAAVNGAANVVISGKREEVDAVLAKLQAAGVESTRLTVSHAFHSPLMEPIVAEFESVARTVRFSAPRAHVVSNVTGRVATAILMADPLYWKRHIRQPVRFADSMSALRDQSVTAFVEIGPKPVLLGMGRECVDGGSWLPSLRQGKSDWATLLGSLGELYVQGAPIAWQNVGGGRKVALPTYAFQRQRYWLETAAAPAHTRASLGAGELAKLAAVGATSAELSDAEKQLLPKVLDWLARQSQPSKSDVVFDYYNALSQTKSAAQASDEEGAGEPFLTFGPLPEVVPGFSWLLTLAHPERYPQFVPLSRRAQEDMRELLFRHVDFSRCGKALDFGCGYGSDLLRLAARYPHVDFTGYTISSEQASIGGRKGEARGIADRVHIHHRDSSRDAFPGGLDLAFGFEVAHHIKDKPALFANLGKHLNDGGLLVLADFISNAEFPIEHAETSSYFVTKEEWVRLLSDNGLELVKGIDISPEAANYLNDPDFAKHLAEVERAGLDPNVKSALESYNQLGRLLRKGLASYVLLTARKRSDAPVAELEGNNTAAIEALASYEASSPRRWLYERAWRPAPLPVVARQAQPDTVIFGDARLGPELADALECTLVTPGTAFARVGSRHWTVRPGHKQDFAEVLREIGRPARQVAFLWGLDSTGPADVARDTGSVLHLVQAIAESGGSPRLLLVTRGSRPEEAPVWGLGGVIAMEHEDLRCVRLELDARGSSTEVELLAAELSASDVEPQVAYRDGARHVARLVRAKAAKAAPVHLDPEANYLITGGLGALGLQVADRLVRAGARHLALTGRSGAKGKEAAIGALERSGVTVRVFTADVADAAAVESMLRELPRLRGVVHAAGVLDDGALLNQSVERFEKVLAPKVAGAWNLHRLTKKLPLDFFVCFSSVASLIGSPGQGSYAAGNAFLDALAEQRRAEGLPALSINWGPWAESGMAARSEGAGRLAAQGVGSIDAEQGLELFVQLLGHDSAQVGAVVIDWRRFPGAQSPFFAECAAGASVAATTPEHAELRAKVGAAAPAERRRLLIAYLQSEVARVLGRVAPPLPHQGFMDLGVDSLMSIELRNCVQTAFGVPLPATLFFKYPTIHDLAQYIASECIGGTAEPAPAVESTPAPASEEETDAEIAEELARLKAAMGNG